MKFNPLANWGKAELEAYVAEHDLPAHPLVAQGFPSVGCWPCTKAVEDPNADVRAGRWAGQDKTECGIHVARAPGAGAGDIWAAISDAGTSTPSVSFADSAPLREATAP
jgi:3'-phosphoadenosine 5'-phosphosulfate sulfotransferase (PAPS reductase)/FAD synthetase